MNIDFIRPLSNAWNQMKKALFQPFDIAKWFVVGFTAFLAGLLDFKGGSNSSFRQSAGENGLYEFFNFPETAREWLVDHPVISSLIVVGIVFIFVLFVVLTWLSSRGKFMFLYNVINDKAEVLYPWKKFAKQGNSLFVWRLVFGLLSFFIMLTSIYYAFMHFREVYFNDIPFGSQIPIIIGMVLWFLLLVIVIGYISLFLDNFVVPIMYKHRLKTTPAWYKFMTIMWPKLGYFILYGLFIFVLAIAVGIAIVAFSFITCCIGLFLLLIPYIGSVILLPVFYTYRAYSVNFLAQFGEDFMLNADESPEVRREGANEK